MHVPPATVKTVDPDTVHTAGVPEANDTSSPGAADADRATWPRQLAFGKKAIVLRLLAGRTETMRTSSCCI